MSNDDVTRRALLRTGVAAGAAALVGPAAVGDTVAVPNDDYETVSGVTDPDYEKGDPKQHYVATEYTLPKAKGGETETPTLFGEIIWPVDPETGETKNDVPVILTYSPYNDIVSPQSEVASIADGSLADYYVPRGYARAVFDVVGCRNSGGCYDYGGYRERITGKQLVEYLGGEPDAEDNYVDSDGGATGTRNVGMIGGSYDGTTAIAAAVEDPDHLAAVIPQVAIDRWYDYAFGGGIRYFLNNEYPTDEGFDTPLAFDLGFGFVPGLNADDGERFVEANERRFAPCDGVEHTERAYAYDPVYDDFWDRRDYRRRATGYQPEEGADAADAQNGNAPVRGVNCAVFLEAGWLDHNVKHWDSTRFFDALPANVPKKLVMGQWPHTSSNFEDARDVRHAWFDEFLKGRDTGVTEIPRVDTQVNTGERLQHEEMPPRGTRVQRFELTRAEAGEDSLALKGTAPVFTDAEPPATEAQMFATDESDHTHLKFETAPLSGPLRITGSIPVGEWRAPLLDIVAATTDESMHVTPVLYERLPDGSTEVITRGFLNARKRNGLDTDEPVPTDEPFSAQAELWDTDYIVREGHRLGLVVAHDNREWCLDDPDGASVTELILGAPGNGGGAALRLPVSEAPDSLDVPAVSGTREDSSSVFTGGQPNHVEIDAEAEDETDIELRDTVPDGWSVYGYSDDIARTETREDGTTEVYFEPTGESVEVAYLAEAPSNTEQTGRYTFGPVEARAADGESGWVAVEGTSETDTVVAAEQP